MAHRHGCSNNRNWRNAGGPNCQSAIDRRFYYAVIEAAVLRYNAAADGGIWRAALDERENYAYAVVL